VKRAVIGRDTRQSGTMIGAALASGLNSAGIEVVVLGVAPTPAISHAVRTGDFGLGGVISASHNPAPDNGIKFMGHDGRKLTDDVELGIEGLIGSEAERPIGGEIGKIISDRSALDAYMAMLLSAVPEGLDGLRVAVDAAHGAAFDLGPEVLRELGASVITTGVEPNGVNINAEGGATKPQNIQDFTVAAGADVGVAFDGDADRAVFSDEKGRLINGDRTMGIWAAHYHRLGKLRPATIVGTVMSNGGFGRHMESLGISLERTPVGDKYVAQRITDLQAQIGGEQSGHLIFPEFGPTGDGLMTMLQLLQVLKREGKRASDFYEAYQPWPQVMINMAMDSKEGWDEKLAEDLQKATDTLGENGRVVVRPSGTQPIIRIMVEAGDYPLRDRVAELLVDAVKTKLGAHIEGRVDLTHALGD
jgi:phosphoglucosamine mutase